MSSSSTFLPCICICILLSLSVFINLISAARTVQQPFKPRALVLPVVKDPSTNQYITTIFQRTPLRAVKVAVDVGGKALWVACDKQEYHSTTYQPALCHSPQCRLANSNTCGDCWEAGPRPNCNNNTCNNVVYNTVQNSGQIGDIGTDVLVLQSTDGSKPGPVVMVRSFLFSCGSLFLGEKLARGVHGIAGFGRSETSLPSLLSSSLKLPNKFAVCLSSSRGVAFIGDGPYTLLPGVTVSARLAYTPLLVNPISTVRPILDKYPDVSRPSTEYFIGVDSIQVDGKPVAVGPNLLRINRKGHGGTKISTVAPYTVLHTSVYNAVTKAFTKAISKVAVVGPVPPFGTCYAASSLGSTRLGPGVPRIDLVLHNNVTWSVFGANSMVYVNRSAVACLAFVDGGKKAATAILIGGHQIEDNLLEFDVDKSRLGFSSSLLGSRTTCANFNFTNK